MKNRARIWKALCLVALGLAILGLGPCSDMNYDVPRDESAALAPSTETKLGAVAAKWNATHSGQSGFTPIPDGMDALGVRIKLAQIAERSIDMQYFLMKPDMAGGMLSVALLEAADRGVHIRFLIDDIFTTVPDDYLMVLGQHPNIEVRVFNPINRKGFYWLNYLGTFKQTNGRMHNKSFTVDNAVTIVGGRNIADEYYSLVESDIFYDFDMMAVGAIAQTMSRSFDIYWNYERALPVKYIKKKAPKMTLDELRDELNTLVQSGPKPEFLAAYDSQILKETIDKVTFYPATGTLISDDPDKVAPEKTVDKRRLAREFMPIVQAADKEVVFISPYFIPGDIGIDLIQSLTDRGVRVIIVTNSLATNNHTSAQSAYSAQRKDILRTQAELYELRADYAYENQIKSGETPDKKGHLTMHNKITLIDGDQAFVGSLNLDARSINLNTEMGVLIDSQDLVDAMTVNLDHLLEAAAYRVKLTDKGKVEWTHRVDGKVVTKTHDPDTSWFRRVFMQIAKLAPDSQL